MGGLYRTDPKKYFLNRAFSITARGLTLVLLKQESVQNKTQIKNQYHLSIE